MQDKAYPGLTRGGYHASAAPPMALLGTGAGLLALYTATTFLSALLLFSVQPMFAKMVLPILGGAPSVWAVAMVFFQAALLAGYCYAHLLNTRLKPWMAALVHLAVCIAAIAALPIGVPQSLGDPPAGDPALWQLALFAVGVGLPFFAVSANAPMLQAWFAVSGHRQAGDPYFLYGASNLGSLLALLSYPLVLEPAFGLSALAQLWAYGFVALVALLAIAMAAVRHAPGVSGLAGEPLAAGMAEAPRSPDVPIRWRRLGWVCLAFVPSALLTAFTNHITMDVASAPLLWVLPLALYLSTFVLVFRERPIAQMPAGLLAMLVAGALWSHFGASLTGAEPSFIATLTVGQTIAVAFIVLMRSVLGLSAMVALRCMHVVTFVLALAALAQTENEGWFVTSSTGVAVFFAATMVAHRTLYETRPAAGRLTEFYLLMSLGGVLGGLFSALIAPRLFSQIYEYPLLLALTMACRQGALSIRLVRAERDNLLTLWLVAAFAMLALFWLPRVLDASPAIDGGGVPAAAWWLGAILDGYGWLRVQAIAWGATVVLVVLFGLGMALTWRDPARQLVLALAAGVTVVVLPSGVHRTDALRSYFGVYRVYSSGEYNILTHGTTLHGAQRMRDAFGAPAADATPGTYYYPDSPMARSVALIRSHVSQQGGTKRFGVVGLGSGSLACLAAEGERWRIFEIDPLMVWIASNPSNFTYLESCQPKPPDIVIGDARLTLAREPDGAFDIIIVDAFTSDAVPIHLMTAEALQLYLAKVSANGVAVLHISNRYLDLDSVLAATAAKVPGAHGVIIADDEADGSYAQTTSTIAVFAKSAAALAPFLETKGARDLDAKALNPWTDDYSDIIGPFLSRLRE